MKKYEAVLKLRQTTREIIQLVEELSGIPVQVTEDPKLQTLASVRMARKSGLPQHLMFIKPKLVNPPIIKYVFNVDISFDYFKIHPKNGLIRNASAISFHKGSVGTSTG